MPTTFYNIPNNASTSLISPYSPGDASITVADSSPFGSPSPTNRIRLTATRPSGARSHFSCTGIVGNTLTVAVMDGYTDIALSVGDKIAAYPCKESFNDIHVAINNIEAKTFTTGTGAPSSTPADGSVYIDIGSSTKKMYIRAGGSWYSTTIT